MILWSEQQAWLLFLYTVTMWISQNYYFYWYALHSTDHLAGCSTIRSDCVATKWPFVQEIMHMSSGSFDFVAWFQKARLWKKADQTRYGGCRKCAVSLARYLHNSNSRLSMAQLQQCRIILSSAFGRYCTNVQTVLLSVKLSETRSH